MKTEQRIVQELAMLDWTNKQAINNLLIEIIGQIQHLREMEQLENHYKEGIDFYEGDEKQLELLKILKTEIEKFIQENYA